MTKSGMAPRLVSLIPVRWRGPVTKLLIFVLLLAAAGLARELVPLDWIRVVRLGLGVALAAFVASLAVCLRNAALVIASTLLSLAAIEAYALIEYPRAIDIHTRGSSVEHQSLGWGAAHPGVFHHTKINAKTGRLIHDVDYSVDDHLNRKVDSAATGPAVAFFGDSSTFGSGLSDAETLPQAFADATGRRVRVLNFGVPGYGPQQFLRALEIGLYDDLLNPSRLFVFQTAVHHAERTSCKPGFMLLAPRYELVDGRPHFAGTCARWWSGLTRALFTENATYRTFVAPLVHAANRADIELYLAVLVRAGQIARERYGVPTTILYLRDPAYARRAAVDDQEIMRRLRGSGLRVIDGTLDPSAFPGQPLEIPDDGHPTGVANRTRALLVRDAFEALSH